MIYDILNTSNQKSKYLEVCMFTVPWKKLYLQPEHGVEN